METGVSSLQILLLLARYRTVHSLVNPEERHLSVASPRFIPHKQIVLRARKEVGLVRWPICQVVHKLYQCCSSELGD